MRNSLAQRSLAGLVIREFLPSWWAGGPCASFYETWVNGGPEWERVAVRASDCSRYPTGFLADERGALGDRRYRQEYCCEFSRTEDALVRRDVLDGVWSDYWPPLPEY